MLRLCKNQLVHGILVVHVILAPQVLYMFHLRMINAEVLTYAKGNLNISKSLSHGQLKKCTNTQEWP